MRWSFFAGVLLGLSSFCLAEETPPFCQVGNVINFKHSSVSTSFDAGRGVARESKPYAYLVVESWGKWVRLSENKSVAYDQKFNEMFAKFGIKEWRDIGWWNTDFMHNINVLITASENAALLAKAKEAETKPETSSAAAAAEPQEQK